MCNAIYITLSFQCSKHDTPLIVYGLYYEYFSDCNEAVQVISILLYILRHLLTNLLNYYILFPL